MMFFLSTQGIHERLKKPRKSVIYFTEYKKEGKQIALYFSMPFKQKDNELGLEIPFDKKNKRELDFEMFLVNEIRFDLTDLENGTYFIDYSKDLHLMPNSHEVKTTGEGLLIINIPSKTLNKCKISTEFISKENYPESEN